MLTLFVKVDDGMNEDERRGRGLHGPVNNGAANGAWVHSLDV